jgi:hypothetical protein
MQRSQLAAIVGGVVLLAGLFLVGGHHAAPNQPAQMHGFLSGGFVPSTGAGIQVSGTPSAGESPQWDGVQYQARVLNDYRSKHLEWSHDFLTQTSTDWIASSVSGTGALFAAQSSSVRPGIGDMQTGTTTTGFVRLLGTNSTEIDFASNSQVMFEVVGGWPTLSTVGEEYASVIGFGDTTGAINQANGCYFLYDRLPVATAPGTGTITAGSANLQCWCANASTRTGYTMDGAIVSQGGFTTVATPIAALSTPNTNFYRMRVVVTGTSEADFYVDTNNGQGLTKRCVITTNIPSGSKSDHLISIVKSAGTTSRSMYLDWAHLALDLLVARGL